MEFIEGIASLPIIVASVYGLMVLYKQAVKNSERAISLIPVFSALLGIILGGIMFYASPQIIPADNLFSALLIGGVSGWSATGINQTTKQLVKCRAKEDSVLPAVPPAVPPADSSATETIATEIITTESVAIATGKAVGGSAAADTALDISAKEKKD